jgi:hypothetical protein
MTSAHHVGIASVERGDNVRLCPRGRTDADFESIGYQLAVVMLSIWRPQPFLSGEGYVRDVGDSEVTADFREPLVDTLGHTRDAYAAAKSAPRLGHDVMELSTDPAGDGIDGVAAQLAGSVAGDHDGEDHADRLLLWTLASACRGDQ